MFSFWLVVYTAFCSTVSSAAVSGGTDVHPGLILLGFRQGLRREPQALGQFFLHPQPEWILGIIAGAFLPLVGADADKGPPGVNGRDHHQSVFGHTVNPHIQPPQGRRQHHRRDHRLGLDIHNRAGQFPRLIDHHFPQSVPVLGKPELNFLTNHTRCQNFFFLHFAGYAVKIKG